MRWRRYHNLWFLAIQLAVGNVIAHDDTAEYLLKDGTGPREMPHFETLNLRSKRNTEPTDEVVWEIPKDYEVETDSKQTDHTYYGMSITSGNETELQKYFVNIDHMLSLKGVVGNSSHPLLSGSYRRAVAVKLTFEFPFYGHRMSSITIATGGFLYIGDQSHNWLAATQYIAPLMANFDTSLNGSVVVYADDGDKFVVEWRMLQLRIENPGKPYTFQAILHKNGDIVFAYKDVPTANISDAHHPVKLGISDAYLYNHGTVTDPPRRVIYEYHRIEIPQHRVLSNTVVVLEAQPTCIQLTTCDSCANATLKNFDCSWCHAAKENGGPFCTDTSGLNRRRQSWVEGNCRDRAREIVCKGDDYDEKDDDSRSSMLPTDGKHSEVFPSKVAKDESGGGYATLVFLFGFILCFVGWVAYAYYNPHTTSGQLLIKYRPSRWHVPNSHVRYSASVHM